MAVIPGQNETRDDRRQVGGGGEKKIVAMWGRGHLGFPKASVGMK